MNEAERGRQLESDSKSDIVVSADQGLYCTITFALSENRAARRIGVAVLVQLSVHPKKRGPVRVAHSFKIGLLGGDDLRVRILEEVARILEGKRITRAELRVYDKAEKRHFTRIVEEPSEVAWSDAKFMAFWESLPSFRTRVRRSMNSQARILARRVAEHPPKREDDPEQTYFGYTLDEIIEMENAKLDADGENDDEL